MGDSQYQSSQLTEQNNSIPIKPKVKFRLSANSFEVQVIDPASKHSIIVTLVYGYDHSQIWSIDHVLSDGFPSETLGDLLALTEIENLYTTLQNVEPADLEWLGFNGPRDYKFNYDQRVQQLAVFLPLKLEDEPYLLTKPSPEALDFYRLKALINMVLSPTKVSSFKESMLNSKKLCFNFLGSKVI